MSHMRSDARLMPFEQRWADGVLGWIASPEELFHWSARTDFPLVDTSVFDRWHTGPQVSAHVLLVQGEAVAYGELWLDNESAVELARLIVAPDNRRRGFGTRLIEELCRFAGRSSASEIWLRVLPTNLAARRCYESAGFRRAVEEQQAAFNAGQRFRFVWLVRSNPCDAVVG